MDGQAQKGVEDQKKEPYGWQLENLTPHPQAVGLAQDVEMEGQRLGQSPIAPADVGKEGQVEQQTQSQEDVYEAIRLFDPSTSLRANFAQDKPDDPHHEAAQAQLPDHHYFLLDEGGDFRQWPP
jgi:hypothetical protein